MREVSKRRENRGSKEAANVSTRTNKGVAERSVYRIGMYGGESQHTPSMRCTMREKTKR
jgi:hypothetical protein